MKAYDSMSTEPPQLQPGEIFKEKVLFAAVANSASDIHIDPTENELIVRFRVDGVLAVWNDDTPMTYEDYTNFASHLKVLSDLDITQHEIPQEGHFLWMPPITHQSDKPPRPIDVRASFFPTVYGEAIVLRLLNRSEMLIQLQSFFSEKEHLAQVMDLIVRPYGMVLVTGPTNSGKTTILYSMLNELANGNRNIITLEDPVEYFLRLVRQSQIKPQYNYSFAVGLRSILRQDPDVIMVGEIRDLETAENAIRASLTGRLLLSTLHANNSVGSISRLIDMGVERHLVAYALNGVINQRLVRKVCQHCKESRSPSPTTCAILQIPSTDIFSYGKGCAKCNGSGFSGRLPLFEVLLIDEELRRMILENTAVHDLQALAQQKGMKLLREDGMKKMRAGVTTPEEVIKATM